MSIMDMLVFLCWCDMSEMFAEVIMIQQQYTFEYCDVKLTNLESSYLWNYFTHVSCAMQIYCIEHKNNCMVAILNHLLYLIH